MLLYLSIAALNIAKSDIFAQPPALLLLYCCFTAALPVDSGAQYRHLRPRRGFVVV
jgi:hypothetical protein